MKERRKSTTLLILESLNLRMPLTLAEKRTYQNQVKGFEGECLFDQHINQSNQKGLIINDLLLSTKHTYYQIDSLLIQNQHIHLYEIKNYTGSYTIKDGTMFAESGHSIQNPLDQVNRKKSYLHNLLLNMGKQCSISAYVAYVQPNFYIYSLPPTKPILFHGQLQNHFDRLVPDNRTLAVEPCDIKLAEYLISQHCEGYRPNQLPDYTFDNLKKGIFCSECFSFEFTKDRLNRTCTSCGFKERIADAIYRSVLEFQLLFPEMPINVQNIVLWCGRIYSDYHIRSVLNKYFTLYAKGRSSFYS